MQLQKVLDKKLDEVYFADETYNNILVETDKLFKKGIIECYTRFCPLQYPIVSHEDYATLIQLYKDTMAVHYRIMQKTGFW